MKCPPGRACVRVAVASSFCFDALADETQTSRRFVLFFNQFFNLDPTVLSSLPPVTAWPCPTIRPNKRDRMRYNIFIILFLRAVNVLEKQRVRSVYTRSLRQYGNEYIFKLPYDTIRVRTRLRSCC